jgi:hypothetical protein
MIVENYSFSFTRVKETIWKKAHLVEMGRSPVKCYSCLEICIRVDIFVFAVY